MVKEKKTQREHYVPQSYLERFTFGGKRLYVFDKFSKEARTASIRDVAQERYFYDIPLDAIKPDAANPHKEHDPQLEEKALCALESSFADAYNAVLKIPETHSLSKEHRRAMALCVTVQFLRTRTARNWMTEFYEKGTEAILNTALKIASALANTDHAEKLKAVVEKYNKPKAAILHGSFMWNPELVSKLAATLYHHIWLVCVNETSKPLYTSDHPVVMQSEVKPAPPTASQSGEGIGVLVEFDSGLPGFGSRGVEIMFPLTPDRVLVALDRAHFTQFAELGYTSARLHPSAVERYNRLQVLQSYRQVFCSTDSFELARKICDEHPEVCSPNRDTVEVNLYDEEFTLAMSKKGQE
jgi:hypothetical protein